MGAVAKLLRTPLATGFLVSILVSLAILGLRGCGNLESLELAAYDWFIRLRPSDAQPDPRIVLVTITEQDIQTLGSWPLSDDVLAQVLESVARFGPRAIGVDIYRDFQVPPGSERLDFFLRKNRRIIWVSKFGQGKTDGILPPKALRGTENVGFNDIVVDPGGVVRRPLRLPCGWPCSTCNPKGSSFSRTQAIQNSSGLVHIRCDRLNRMTVPMSLPMLADISSCSTLMAGGDRFRQ